MSKYQSLGLLAIGWLLCSSHPVVAQYDNPYNRPRVSPYLQLLRQGNSAGVNYATLVRPQLDFQRQLNQVQDQASANSAAITGLSQGAAGPLVTGTAVGFQTHLGYFQNQYSGGGGVGFGGFGGGGGGVGGVSRGSAFGGPSFPAMGGSNLPPSRGGGIGRSGSAAR
jgi:hypothetical protein